MWNSKVFILSVFFPVVIDALCTQFLSHKVSLTIWGEIQFFIDFTIEELRNRPQPLAFHQLDIVSNVGYWDESRRLERFNQTLFRHIENFRGISHLPWRIHLLTNAGPC